MCDIGGLWRAEEKDEKFNPIRVSCRIFITVRHVGRNFG